MSTAIADAFRKMIFAGMNDAKAHNITRADRVERGIVAGCQTVGVVDDTIKFVGETQKGQAAINALSRTLNSTATTSKAFDVVSKGVYWAGKAVNPILCVAALSRALADEDKKSAFIEEFSAMGSMFLVEGAIKRSLGLGGKTATYMNNKALSGAAKWGKNLLASIKWLNKVPTNRVTALIKGAIFVIGSCLAFSTGKEVAKHFTKNTTRKDFELAKMQKEQALIASLTASSNGTMANIVS